MRQLFRQAALDTLSNPEQFEQVLKITPARSILIVVGCCIVIVGLLIWSVTGSIPYTVDAYGLLVQNPGYTRVVINAPTDGEITEILVGRDERVEIGQVIARLSADEGIIDIESQYAGTVSRINVRRNEEVRANSAVISLQGDLAIDAENAPLEAVLYLPYSDVQMVTSGMNAYVVPEGLSTLEYGYLKGTVISIAQFPSTDQFARAVSPNKPVVAIRIALTMEWTLSKNPPLELRSGMQLVGQVLIREERPIDRLIRQSQNAR